MTEMAITPASMRFGPCQVKFNNVELGATMGGVEFRYDVTWLDVEVDQSSMPVDAHVQKEVCVATVPMTEIELSLLQNVLKTGTYTLDGGGVKKKIEVGGAQPSAADIAKELVITPLSDVGGTLSADANRKVTIHKAHPRPQLTLAYSKDGIRIIPVEFHGLRDGTKDAGKQFFLLGDSSAAA